MKTNCWEFKNCGREPNGSKVDELGACPASTETRLNGVHGGKNAGRACWVVAGTMCSGKPRGTFAKQYSNCRTCDFYLALIQEEGLDLELSIELLSRIKINNVTIPEYNQ
jgi:hypothetical protein